MLRKAPGFTLAAVTHAGARRRREHGDLQRGACAVDRAASLRGSGTARLRLGRSIHPRAIPRAPLSGPELIDLDTRSSLFDGFGAIWATTAALTGDNEPEQLRIGLVSSDFFSLLGANAAIGRTFVASDEVTGPPTSILLSAAVWQRRYGGDPSIAGKRILVNGRPTTVVGVMPAAFRLLMPPDAAVPDDLEAWQLLDRALPEFPRGQRFLRVVGRMQSGVSLADAQQDVARVGAEISKAYTHYGAAGRKFETVSLHADAVRDIRGPLLAMFGAVGAPAGDRVRECGQPVDCARRIAHQGNRGARGARRRQRPVVSPAPD